MPFALIPFINLHHFLIYPSHFLFNALRLAAFYYADPSFLMIISFLIYPFLIYVHFFQNHNKGVKQDLNVFRFTAVYDTLP
jgi:hypothetical protein